MYESYEITSKFYDLINSHVDHKAWCDLLVSALEKYSKSRPELVLDLGCGTGVITLMLAERGFDMTGVDISPEMLDVARERAEEKGLDVLWLCQDMREFELYGTVDAAVMTNDAINYLLKNKDLDAVFSLVHNYLVPEGIFIFDISTKGKFSRLYRGDIIIEEDGLYCGWQNYYNEKKGTVDFYLSYFVEEDGGWQRYDESQRERAWSCRGIIRALKKNGFSPLLLTGSYDLSPADEKTADEEFDRLYFVCRVEKTEKSGNNGL